MLIGKPNDIPSSEITPKDVYLRRREFIGKTARGLVVAAAAPTALLACGSADGESAQEELTPREYVTTYNNFYEFGTGKDDPSELAHLFNPRPWTVEIGGLVDKPGEYHLEDLLAPSTIEDRTYRLRCVEAWSMVIPWQGIPLADVLNRAEPRPGAEFVKFTTVFRPAEMPGQRRPILDWPYVEGLRMDEAMHPLTILATGLYGDDLLGQNGAPLRLVVPWKYGFKSIKSIVKIELTDSMPLNTWQEMQSNEYGFYANVNPNVDHPRWSQARERRIGELGRRRTLMFNGYGDQVAQLYQGMDLRRWF